MGTTAKIVSKQGELWLGVDGNPKSVLTVIDKHIQNNKGFDIEMLYKEIYQDFLKHYKNEELVNQRLILSKSALPGEYTYLIRPDGIYVRGILNKLQENEFNRIIKAGVEKDYSEFLLRNNKVMKKGSKYYFLDQKSGKVREILK